MTKSFGTKLVLIVCIVGLIYLLGVKLLQKKNKSNISKNTVNKSKISKNIVNKSTTFHKQNETDDDDYEDDNVDEDNKQNE